MKELNSLGQKWEYVIPQGTISVPDVVISNIENINNDGYLLDDFWLPSASTDSRPEVSLILVLVQNY